MEIKFNDVSYHYNRNTKIEHKVLDNINLSIKEGKITSIIGRSGSGKSTITQLMNVLLLPTEGTLEIGKCVVSTKGLVKNKKINDLRVNVGLIFQFPEEQFFNMTVYEEISFGMKYFKYKDEDIKKRVSDALKMVGLTDEFLDRNPFILSNGEKRKVAIASILAYNPKIIILDEPTVGLDYASKKNLLQLLRKLKMRYNKTVVLISHDIELVHSVSDYVILIDAGKIVTEGDKYYVFKQEELLKKYGMKIPKMIEFSNLVYQKKGIKIGYRDEINDLIKDIYRYVK